MPQTSSTLIIGIFSFLILAAIALLFLYLHLKSVRDEIKAYWKTILDKMRIRDDMVPNLIETVRKYTKDEEKILNELTALRAKSWPMEKADGQKVNAELSLTDDLRAVWKLPQKVPALNLDTNFLSLKKDFHDLGKEIDGMVDVYNKKIRSFNGQVGFALMGMNKFPIFEFEP